MRKVYEGNSGFIRYWTKEIVFSNYGVFDLVVEKDTFYYASGKKHDTFTGQVYRKGEWRGVTKSFESLQELLQAFRILFY